MALPTDTVPPVPEIPLTPDMKMILEGIAQSVMLARQQAQVAEQRFQAYVVQCATALNVNSPRYQFDPQKCAFQQNPHFTGVTNKESDASEQTG